jgi:NADH dehydrogenase
MLYQPLLREVASGSVEPRHSVIPLRHALRHTRVTQGKLTGLDHRGRTATITVSEGPAREIRYDLVVLRSL